MDSGRNVLQKFESCSGLWPFTKANHLVNGPSPLQHNSFPFSTQVKVWLVEQVNEFRQLKISQNKLQLQSTDFKRRLFVRYKWVRVVILNSPQGEIYSKDLVFWYQEHWLNTPGNSKVNFLQGFFKDSTIFNTLVR